MSRRWRPVALRQVTGLQIITIVAVWIFGVILGFGLVYFGQMSRTSFSAASTGDPLDFFGAMYFSAAQLATVGGSYLTAETDVLRFLSIAESLTGVILVSLILAFLLGVYGVISDLSALCTRFFSAERGAGSPVASLKPYFRDGQPNGLDGHLDAVAGTFASYTDGLRLHHAAYYFQSGRDRFALPYAVRMLGGTLGALRWGLPSTHPATSQPGLVPLTFQFLEFGEYLERTARWQSAAVPEVVGAEEFARLVADPHQRDEWVARFVELDRDMAALAGVTPLADLDEAYRRYTRWLPFAHRAQQITLAVSRDLDYQPIIVSDAPVSILRADDDLALQSLASELPVPTPPSGEPDQEARGRLSRWRMFADRHLSLVDPGHARLRTAVRAVVAAVAAVASLHLVFDLLGESPVPPAFFGGFVAMLSTGVSVDKTVRGRKVTSLLVVVPVALVVLLGALVSGSFLWTAVLLVTVALVGVGAGRFGPRWAAIGRVTFMAYYFALILRLELSDVLLFTAAAVLGVAWAYLLNHVVLPERPRTVLRRGVEGFGERLVTSTDMLVDAVSWSRWDVDVRKRAALDMHQLHRGASFLAGQLTGEPAATGVDRAHGALLRLRVFDTELAAVNLTSAAHAVTGTTLPLELRGRLAGRLELLQTHLAALVDLPTGARSGGRPPPWPDDRPPATWPPQARALHHAADELHRAAAALRDATLAALDPEAPPLAHPDADDLADADQLAELEDTAATETPAAGRRRISPPTRRAVQAAVTTGAALVVGDAVSATHQYWATLAAYQVLGGTDGETFVKGTQRIVGTVFGAAVGFGVAIWSGADAAVIAPLLAVAVFGSTYYRPVSPAVSTFWTTMIFALIYEFLGSLTTLAVEIRVVETLFGAAVALLVAWLVLPTHTRTKLDHDMTSLVTEIRVVVAASLRRLEGDTTISAAAIERRLLGLDQHVRQVNVTAAPLRRASGSFEVGGIESQLTAVWSLTYSTRRLVHAVEQAVEAGVEPGSEDWAGLRRATGENLSALTVALAGQLPGHVHDDLVLDVEEGAADRLARPEDAVLHQLEWINQTVLLLLATISPGAVRTAGSPDTARTP